MSRFQLRGRSMFPARMGKHVSAHAVTWVQPLSSLLLLHHNPFFPIFLPVSQYPIHWQARGSTRGHVGVTALLHLPPPSASYPRPTIFTISPYPQGQTRGHVGATALLHLPPMYLIPSFSTILTGLHFFREWRLQLTQLHFLLTPTVSVSVMFQDKETSLVFQGKSTG